MGEIKIMVQTLFPPIYIPKGTRLAQLIPLSNSLKDMQVVGTYPERGARGFGSTGDMAMLTLPMGQ